MGGKRCFKNDSLRTKMEEKYRHLLTKERKKECASNLYTVYKSVGFFCCCCLFVHLWSKKKKVAFIFSAVTALPAAVFSWGCEFMVPSDHVGAII